jgi:predicted transcriptional regulator
VQYTDPPGMPDDERMTDAEFRCVREWLGLTDKWVAAHLDVDQRTVRRWEAGTSPIPDGVREELEALEAMTGEAVAQAVAQLQDVPDVTVVVYRTDAGYRSAVPKATMPASWHRRVVMRAALDVPGVAITYEPGPA